VDASSGTPLNSYPDGTYVVEVSTPGPGQRETVRDEFTIKGCGPGLPFTGNHTPELLVIGFGLLVVGAILLRRAQLSYQGGNQME
jgi:hypothetical protein